MLMVLRREDGELRRYVHLGSGNYHPRTTRFYTDFGLFTCQEEICDDVHEIFKQITGLGQHPNLHHLLQAPFTLQSSIVALIRAESAAAARGLKARIIAKMNALLEPEVIAALYQASQAGVEIDLLVRGACALRPGVPGLSERIRVRSVVGRFLEHTRIFYFHAEGAESVYLSSADWMERNFFRRIETCFPVLDAKLRRRVIKEGLRPYLADNRQAWDMDGAGQYSIRPSRRSRICAQELLLASLAKPG